MAEFNPDEEARKLALKYETAARQEAAKNVEKADASVREEEKKFAKGIPHGAVDAVKSLPVALANLLPFVDIYTNSPEYFKNQFVKEHGGDTSSIAGYELGQWLDLLEPLSKVIGAATITGKILTKEDEASELAQLVKEQAMAMKRDKIMGGSSPLLEKTMDALKEAQARFGVNLEKVKPERLRDPNTTAFPVSNREGKTMVYHSQTEQDPFARSGVIPTDFPEFGNMMVDASKYAGRRMEHWQGGQFNPEQFKEHVVSTLNARVRKASKGVEDGPPKFWVYDEAKDQIIVVQRKKDGSLYIGKPPTNPPKAIEGYEEVTLANGKKKKVPIYNENIDVVVPSGGRELIDEMLIEHARSMSDLPLPKIGKTEEGVTNVPLDKDVRDPSSSVPSNLMDTLENTEWQSMTPQERATFKGKLAEELRPYLEEYADAVKPLVKETTIQRSEVISIVDELAPRRRRKHTDKVMSNEVMQELDAALDIIKSASEDPSAKWPANTMEQLRLARNEDAESASFRLSDLAEEIRKLNTFKK